MDVSCPQCRTEYEFEDARIPDDGLTVKCTQCAHVFRMKKRDPEIPRAEDSQPGREWRLRQASGNVFTFRWLTTLQKWIVERKVQRDDEISLTGETWKRLGDIAELASFFQVVDDAARGNAKPSPAVAPPPPPLSRREVATQPEAPIKPKLIDTLPAPGFSSAPPRPPASVHTDETIRGGGFVLPPQRRPPDAVRSAHRQPDNDDDLKLQKQGGALKWVALALIILGAGGAGGYYYLNVWLPEQQKAQTAAAEEERAAGEAQQKLAQEKAAALIEEAAAKANAEAESKRDAGVAPVAGVVDAGPVLVAGVDAGAPPVAAVPKPAAAPAKPKDFDQLLAEGERLRARDHAEAALALFTKAAELRPDRVEPQSAGGFALLDLEKPGEAEAAFRGALAVNGRYGPALIGMAEASKALGKKAQAVEYYQKYLDVLPEGPEAAVAKNSIERLKGP
jgi:predicted Zn finger-like uncharacterized protein